MHIARFSDGDDTRLGLKVADGLVDLTARLEGAPRDTVDLMSLWPDLALDLAALAAFPADHALTGVQLLAPVRRPHKILGIGMNYADHAREMGLELPTSQFWFSKQSSALNDPFGDVEMPVGSIELDYEAELVCVIGRHVRNADATGAREAIFGYCVGNDVSVRDRQTETSQVMLGKCGDTHAPVGPWITTADAIDVADIAIRTWVNGDLRQNSRTREIIYDCVRMIEHLSRVMTLEPGDLLFTGSPYGVGKGFSPPRWLQPGDRVRVEIEGLGAIENKIVPAPIP
ncbi:hypothetical protein GCM10009087_50890 [Sphingomonas oligophenolica]|uniref:Fumarylacetoacetate hydrolase family protein n=1 Tax=Sphingomonas oligophenolica TaxID=301154 RepID=A0ABU9Y6H1_9SPHN